MDISGLRERSFDNTLTVTELNSYIKRIFDSDRTLTAISVRGEISNLVYHNSGHLYFSLKDEGGQIKAVMFRSSAQGLNFVLENGMKVIIFGSVSVYQQSGSYQLYARSIQPDGVGALYLAYEQMKKKLEAEGLFDERHKKLIPLFPERVGVITSPTGAAIRDIINVLGRRCPISKVYLYPSLVQGDGAAENLISALDYFDKSNLCDVIIIGRGGGSIEDLWAFNNEALARKIFSMSVPVISAVGHETDFTICDFVADLRAPTPSAAAELAVGDIKELMVRVDLSAERLYSSLLTFIERKREKLLTLVNKEIFKNPKNIIKPFSERLFDSVEKIKNAYSSYINEKKTSLLINAEKLNALNPLAVLMRGFGVIEKDGKIVKSVSDALPGDELLLKLSDGVIEAKVNRIRNEKI